MKPRRWIIVDKRKPVGANERYRGRAGWSDRVRSPFLTRDEADRVLGRFCPSLMDACVIRPVRPAGTKRDADAALTAELEGLRATDAEMASRAAAAEQRAAGWASAYQSVSAREDRTRAALGAVQGDPTDEVARRIIAERDQARRDLGEIQRAIEVLIARVAT